MSIRTIARVWEGTQHSGSALAMLLAIADFADDNGRAFPAVGTLAEKCRTQPRNAQYILHKLEDSGELSIFKNQGPHGANLYQINLPPVGVQPIAGVQSHAGVQPIAPGGATHCAKGVQHIAPKPSENRQEPSTELARSPRGSRLPSDWLLPANYQEWVISELGWTEEQVQRVAERFADYWHSAAGTKATKADWFATWRNWCRSEKTPPPAKHAQTLTRHQQNQAAIAASLFGSDPRNIGLYGERVIQGEVLE